MNRSLLTIMAALLSGLYLGPNNISLAETSNNVAETCHLTINEQVQTLRESRQAFQEALEKENRLLFDAAIIDLDYAAEVLDDALAQNVRQRQAALLKPCREGQQIKSMLHFESMISIDRQIRCHRLVNLANIDYQNYEKNKLENKSEQDLKRYKLSVAQAIKDPACSKQVKDRLQASLKRLQK